MSNWTKDLIVDLQQKFGEGDLVPNSLELFGISPKILSYGLPNDQLYVLCRTIMKGIIAKLHPDQETAVKVSKEKLALISSAFEMLKDQKKFNLAVDELRQSRSAESDEINKLKSINTELHDRLAQKDSRISSLETELFGQEKKENLWVSTIAKNLGVSTQQVCRPHCPKIAKSERYIPSISGTYRKLFVLHFEIETIDKEIEHETLYSFKQAYARMKSLSDKAASGYSKREKKDAEIIAIQPDKRLASLAKKVDREKRLAGWDYLKNRLVKLGISGVKSDWLFESALEKSTHFPVVDWDPRQAFAYYDMEILAKSWFPPNKVMGKAANSFENRKTLLNSISEKYHFAFNYLQNIISNNCKYVKILKIQLEELVVEQGVIRSEHPDFEKKIVTTVPLEYATEKLFFVDEYRDLRIKPSIPLNRGCNLYMPLSWLFLSSPKSFIEHRINFEEQANFGLLDEEKVFFAPRYILLGSVPSNETLEKLI